MLTHSDKVMQLHGVLELTSESYNKRDNHMAPAGCRTHRHARREILQNMIISYIKYINHNHSFGHTTSHALQKQVRHFYLYFCMFYGASRAEEEPFLTCLLYT